MEPAPAEPTIDRAALEKVLQLGGPALLRRLIDMFLDNAPQRLERARTAARDGDLDGLERAAHSLKSTAGNLGARRLQALAERIEEEASLRHAGAAGPLMQDMEDAFAATRNALLEEREALES